MEPVLHLTPLRSIQENCKYFKNKKTQATSVDVPSGTHGHKI